MSQEKAIVSLGSQLAEARKAKGWKLADMSSRTGRDPARLSEMENGRGNTTIEHLADAGSVLGLRLVFVPEDKLPEVMKLIGRKPSDSRRTAAFDVPSVLSDVFVDDSEEEDEGPRHGGP